MRWLLVVHCALLTYSHDDETSIAQQHMGAVQRYMQTREAAALQTIRSGLRAAAAYPQLRTRIASDLVRNQRMLSAPDCLVT